MANANNSIPSELVAKPVKKTPLFGCMKDKIREADDHDWFEPMEDFKEYM